MLKPPCEEQRGSCLDFRFWMQCDSVLWLTCRNKPIDLLQYPPQSAVAAVRVIVRDYSNIVVLSVLSYVPVTQSL